MWLGFNFFLTPGLLQQRKKSVSKRPPGGMRYSPRYLPGPWSLLNDIANWPGSSGISCISSVQAALLCSASTDETSVGAFCFVHLSAWCLGASKWNSSRLVRISQFCVVRNVITERLVRTVRHWVHVSHCERNSSRLVRVCQFCVVINVTTERLVRAVHHWVHVSQSL